VKTYDVIVAGAGPAGATAALRMARKGLKVLLVERGRMPGSKNMFGGMLPYCPVLEELLPGFLEEAPLERHVVKRTITVLAESSATSIVFESRNFDRPPYSGYTLFRPVFDRWLAEKAVEAGARLMTGCLAEDVIRDGKAVAGVRVGREDGGVRAPVTIACDGVLSLLARKAGLRDRPGPAVLGLGVKALFRLDEGAINERFGLVRDQGSSHEFIGCTEGIRGGGFIYTQAETLSAGLVLHLDSLRNKKIPPADLLERFLELDPVRKLLKDARMVEYSAHLIPEGGYGAVPRLYSDGMLLAGDAAGLCYTNGLNLEGMNLAVTSGFLAAETAIDALGKGDFSAGRLSEYAERLRDSFVLRDMKTYRKSAGLMENDRLFSEYPEVIGRIMERIYGAGGKPRKAFGRIAWEEATGALPVPDLLADLVKGGGSIL
jgi:electron transfer flavoprotein-quinone oxidoreductase